MRCLLLDAEGDTQGNQPPKDLSSVFEEIAQKAQEQFELVGGEQTLKRPPISIPSDSELVSVLDDARDNIMCDMHKNRDYYYLTCRVPKPRKESQVKPRAMMLRRRRIAKAKAIVGQLLGEAHGFTDAEVEEFTLQYMNLSEQLVFKPGDDQQAKFATQTLLHMDCNVMSDQQVTNLPRASQHPWITGAKLVKQRKELTQEVIPKYGLEVGGGMAEEWGEDLVELKQYAGEMLKTFESWEKDGWTSSATGIKYDVQLYVTGDMKWLRTVCCQRSAGADHFCYMCLCHKNDRGDLSRMGHPMRDSATADKTTPGMAHDPPGRWQRIQSFWKAWWQQFRKINTPTPFEPAAALLWQSQNRKVFRDATSPTVQPEHPKIVSGEWKVEMEGDPYSFICWAHRPQDEDGRHPAVTPPWLHVKGVQVPVYIMRPPFCLQKCFKTHMADSRQDEPDISDVINVDKSHFWERCDFVAANEDD
eukprot:g36141.t1